MPLLILTLAAEAFKRHYFFWNNREVTPELILDIVSEHFGISVKDIKSNKRNAEIAVPRQIAMYLIRSMTETSLKAIGVIWEERIILRSNTESKRSLLK